MESSTVFICCSEEDLVTANRLERELSRRGLSVWCDPHHSHSSPEWTRAVDTEISSSRLIALLWSQHSAKSPFVEFEYTKASALNKVILPCLLDPTPLTHPLTALDGIPFEDYDQGLERLLQSMASLGILLPGGERDSLRSGNGAPPETTGAGESAGTILGGALNLSRDPAAGNVSIDSRSQARKFGPAELQLGDRYQVIKILGTGGMGAVYHVYDAELERDAALKVIRADLAEDPALLKRFKREIQLSSTVTHRNVLRVYDLGEKGDTRFLTMQYVEGEDLRSLLRKEGRLALPRLLSIFRQICEGLAAAHEKGILHRDLKPANIMIDRDDVAYITDFGLARSVAQSGLTRAGDVMGTPQYMSPEQVKGEPVDVRSDIYALGVILYEMVTGEVPYSGDTVYEVMIQRVQKPPRPARELNPDTPPFLENIIRRCMAIDKLARYSSVAELLNDLGQGAETGRIFTASRFYLRHWRATVASRKVRRIALAFPVVLLLVLGGLWLGQRSPVPSPQPAPHEPVSVLIADFRNLTGDPRFNGTLEQAMGTSLEGASFLTAFDRAQARRIAGQLESGTSDLTEETARLVANREGINVIVDGTISAEGQDFAVNVRAIDASTGKPLVTADTGGVKREEVLASLGRLSARIRTTLGDTTPESAQLMAAETFTSSSLEAAQSYAEGQKLQGAGKWQDAITAYRKAVEIDPGLGRAYAGMAVAYRNLGQRDEAERQYQLALKNIDRMTDREKYKTRGGYFLVIGNYPKAIEELTRLINLYPADFAGHTNLALAYFFSREMGPAMDEARRATRIYPNNAVMRSNLALFSMYAGDFKSSAEMARKIMKEGDARWRTYVCLAASTLVLGNVQEATETYKKLEALGPEDASIAATGLADLAMYQGRNRDAVDILTAGIAADRKGKDAAAALRKTMTRADALLQLGRKREALADTGRVVASNPSAARLFEAARLYGAAGDEKKALEISSRLETGLQEEPRLFGKLIEGEVSLARGDVWDAIKLFHEAQNLTDTWLGRYDLGRAYIEGSAFTEAYSELEQCLKRSGEAVAVFLDDVPSLRFLPPAYYYLGRAQEGIGSAGAAESYRKFLDIRGNADQDPLVVDAQRRVASISK